MTELEALIFDVDGTLADTERDGHRVAFNLAFADAGLGWEWTPEIYGELLAVTGGKERIAYYVEQFAPLGSHQVATAEAIARLHASKTAFYTNLLAQGGIGLRPGVRRLLREARRRGVRLAIATTTTPGNVSALLESTLGPGSLSWFEVIGAGDIVAAKKPAPDIYFWVLERLRLPPECCMALEDSENGLTSALQAGLSSVLVTVNAYTEQQDFAGAPYVVSDLGEPGKPLRVIAGDISASDFLALDDLAVLHARVVDPEVTTPGQSD
jgi:beta-phosphoglucomutase-like phosphatase (HAD superfamily)